MMVKWRRMEGPERELSDGERKHVENLKSVFLYRWCVDIYRMDIYLMWLDCPLKFDSMVGLLQEVDVPSAPQECIRTIWYNQNLASPKLQTHSCSAMECSHTMRFLDTGWVVQRQPGECSCWNECEIRTSKPLNCRDLDRRWMMPWKEAKRCSWSKSWWKLKWEFSDCLCLVVLYIPYLGYDSPLDFVLVVAYWLSNSLLYHGLQNPFSTQKFGYLRNNMEWCKFAASKLETTQAASTAAELTLAKESVRGSLLGAMVLGMGRWL